MISQTNRRSILDCGRTNSPINSDHLPVKIKLRIASKIPPKGTKRVKATKFKKRKRGRRKEVRNATHSEHSHLSSINGCHDDSNASEIAAELSIRTINNERDNNSPKNQKTLIDRSKLVNAGLRLELKRSCKRHKPRRYLREFNLCN